MKRFISSALLKTVALSILVTVLSSCGGDDEGPKPGGPGGPGGAPYQGQVVVPAPNGGMQIGFTGSNVYYNAGILAVGGQVNAYSRDGYCTLGARGNAIRYCYNGTNCTCFSQPYWQAVGLSSTLSGAAVGSFPGIGAPGYHHVVATSSVIPGMKAYLAFNPTAQFTANMIGYVEIPPIFMQAYPQAFPQGAATPIVGAAFDMSISPGNAYQTGLPAGTYSATGGVLIYTSNVGGQYSGVYLKF